MLNVKAAILGIQFKTWTINGKALHNLSENFEEESDGLVQLEKLRGALTEFSQKKAQNRISDIVFGNREIFPKYWGRFATNSAEHRAAQNAPKLHNF